MRAQATALAAAVLAMAVPAGALAIPPGGPVENRRGATVTVDADVIQPVGTGGVVSYHGSGFSPDETLTVKVDDGLVLPIAGSQPPAPPGADPAVPYTADAFAQVVADDAGEISGSVDLAIAQPAYAGDLASGKHLLRFVTSKPQPRSVHVDFAVSATLPSAVVGAGAQAFVGPAADLPVDYIADHPYDDIPRLIAGSIVPYRLSGFSPNQTLSIKVNDGAVLAPGEPKGVFGTVTTDADGNAAGTIAVPTETPGTYWLRFLAPPSPGPQRSVYAPYAVVPGDGRDVQITTPTPAPGGAVAFHGSGLLRSPVDYWPLDGDGGQTVDVRLDGTGPALELKASGGALDGSLPLPADTALGPHALVFYVGFVAQADGPQAVLTRTFTVAPASDQPQPPAEQPPGEQPPAEQPAGAQPPTAKPEAGPAARIASGSLKVKRGRVALALVPGATRSTVTITIRTAAKVRVGERRRLVTLATRRGYVLPAGGKRRTVDLALTRQGKALLRTWAKVRVKVTLAPRGGRAIARTVTLRRAQ